MDDTRGDGIFSPGSVSLDSQPNKLSTPLLSGNEDYVSFSDESDFNDGLLSDTESGSKNQLGTFIGAYVPCLLAFFGVILFERVGFVIGNAGILEGLSIAIISFITAILTAFSIAAIASNGHVSAGGAYFVISRLMGPEFGGAIGFIYAIGNIVNAAISFIGAAEAMSASFTVPEGRWWIFLYSVVFLVIFTIIAYVGAEAFAKTAFIIFCSLFVAIGISLISLLFQKPGAIPGYTGISAHTFSSNWGPGYTGKFNFQGVLAIFFNSVAGVASGLNLSGDLKDASASLPKGTIAAVITSASVYTSLLLIVGSTFARTVLQTNMFVLQDISFVPWLVAQGIFSACLSTGLSGIIGGSRIIQALARDDLFPFLRYFAYGTPDKDEPTRGVLLCAFLCFLCFFIGDLNAIAPLVTFAFLITYGMTNFASSLCYMSGTVNWRPTFQYANWKISGLGTLLCVAIMFLISWEITFGTFTLIGIMWGYVHFSAPKNTQWGDISQALIFHQVRKYLLRLDNTKVSHIKLWRPAIFFYLEGHPQDNSKLIHFANNIKKGGLFVIGQVLTSEIQPGDDDDTTPASELGVRAALPPVQLDPAVCASRANKLSQFWEEYLTDSSVKAFHEITIAGEKRTGIVNLLYAAGMGAMKSNTFMTRLLLPEDNFQISLTNFSGTTGRKRTDSEKAAGLSLDRKNSPENSIFRHAPWTPSLFVDVLNDAIKLHQNLALCRGFEYLDRSDISAFAKFHSKEVRFTLGKATKKTIDVFPFLSVFSSASSSYSLEATPMLVLQLAYILRRVRGMWKDHTTLRVLTFVGSPDLIEEETARLHSLLQKIRIDHLCGVSVIDVSAESSYQSWASQKSISLENLPEASEAFARESTKTQYTILHSIMQAHSKTTAVSFLPISHVPRPSSLDEELYKSTCTEWLNNLSIFTRDFGPIVFVHGNEMVVSTKL